MENMVIERLLKEIDALEPMIKRAYQTASEEERLFLDQAIPLKFQEIEGKLQGISTEAAWSSKKG